MVSEKGDYRFVTEDAMKHIAISGTPFPLRDGKLIHNGEDEAFLREASIERRYFTEDPYVSAYTAAIWRVKRDIDAIIFNAYKGLVGRFADPDKLARQLEVEVFERDWCADDGDPVEGDPGSYNTVREADADASHQINELRDALYERTDAINERRGREKDAKDAAYIADIAEAERIRRELLTAQEETHANNVQDIENAHSAAVEEIRAAGLPEAETNYLLAIAYDEYRTDILLENAADARITEDIYNAYDGDCNEAAYAMETGKREIDADADEEIRTITEECETAVEGIRASNRSYCFGLLCASGGANDTQLTDHSPNYADYTAGIADLILAKTCAGEFYRKRFAFRNGSAGALDRVFADLERMTTVRKSFGLSRKSYTQRIGSGGSIEYHENSGDMSRTTGGMLVDESDWATYEPSSTDFSIFAGRRKDADDIVCIIADVEIRRDETWSIDKSDKIRAAIDQMEDDVNGILKDHYAPDDPPWEFGDIYYAYMYSSRFIRTNEWNDQPWVGATDAVVSEYNRRLEPPSGDLRSEWGEHYGKYITRAVFTREGVQAASWLARKDGLDDTRDERLAEAEATRAEGYRESEATYRIEVEGADRALEERYEEIEEEYREACDRARATAYAGVIGELPDVNEEIAAEIDITKAIEIREEFMDGAVAEAGREYDRLVILAQQKRQADREDAKEEHDEAVDGFAEEMWERGVEIDEAYYEAANAVTEWYSDEITSFNTDYNAYVRANPDGERYRPDSRVRFTATITKRGTDGREEDDWTRNVYVTGIRNAFVVYAPRTATGADFSKYYEEIEDAD